MKARYIVHDRLTLCIKLNSNKIALQYFSSPFQKRFEGTLVTPESFYAWKAKFVAEFAHLKKAREEVTGKLTGREMFMQDTTLIQSDLKFLEESEGTAVLTLIILVKISL